MKVKTSIKTVSLQYCKVISLQLKLKKKKHKEKKKQWACLLVCSLEIIAILSLVHKVLEDYMKWRMRIRDGQEIFPRSL